MKREPHSSQETQNNSSHAIPDIQINNLDANGKTDSDTETLMESDEEVLTEQVPERKGVHISAHTAMHLALLAVIVIVVIVVINRVGKIGQFISQEDIFKDGEGTYDNTYDQFLPAVDAEIGRAHV